MPQKNTIPSVKKQDSAKARRSEKTSKNHVNRAKLKKELFIITVVILVILGIRFLPEFFASPVPQIGDPYAEYKTIYNDVINYDYSKGPSSSLESRLERAVGTNNNSTRYYFDLKAQAEYSYRIHDYQTALTALTAIDGFVPSYEEQVDVYVLYIKLYTVTGNREKRQEYQALYDELVRN